MEPVSLPAQATANATRTDPLMQRAQELEALFLAEMLSHAGLGEQQGAFGGGIGESQFSSFLRAEQAKLLVERGGIGLAESLFRAMGGRASSRIAEGDGNG